MQRLWKGSIVIGLLAAVVTVGRGLPAIEARAASNDVTQQIGNGRVDWTDGFITVTGSGAAPEKGSAAQKRLMAKRAAQADGYRQLAEVINGVHVDSETVVKDFVAQSDTIKTSVSALVKGALAIATRNMSDGSVEVDVKAKMYGHNGLFDAVDPAVNRKPGPPPTVTVEDEQGVLPSSLLVASNGEFVGISELLAQARPKYSGTVLDIHGLGGEPCMSPSVNDPGDGELYIGQNPVDADFVVNEGIAGYYPTVEDAKNDHDRMGSNPLVFRPTAVIGRFRCTAKLTLEDAKAMLKADRKSKFLKNAKVAFVM